MRRLVLHLGIPKTGTTSIQSFLHANRDRLRTQGVHLSTTLNGANIGNNRDLALCFIRPERFAAQSYAAGGPIYSPAEAGQWQQRRLEHFREELGDCNAREQLWILSSEYL